MAKCCRCDNSVARLAGRATPAEITKQWNQLGLKCKSCGRLYCFVCLSIEYKGLRDAVKNQEADPERMVAALAVLAVGATEGRLLCPECGAKSVGVSE